MTTNRWQWPCTLAAGWVLTTGCSATVRASDRDAADDPVATDASAQEVVTADVVEAAVPVDVTIADTPPATPRVVDLALTIGLECARMSDGTVRCRGSNLHGEVGDGTTTPRMTPATVPGLSGVIQVVVGDYYSSNFACALLADETVRCWGANSYGTDTTVEHHAPTAVAGLAGVTQLAAGDFGRVCARLADGTVRCWGGLSMDPRIAAVPGLSGVAQVVVGATSDECVRLMDGTVRCHEFMLDVGVTQAVDLATSVGSHVCALRADGTLRCWGYNPYGELGDGTTVSHYVFTPMAAVDPSLAGVRQVAAGCYHTCTLMADRTVRCWGSDDHGQLGTGPDGEGTCSTVVLSPACRLRPTVVPGLAGAERLALGTFSSCAIFADGRVLCWGGGEGFRSPTPVPVVW